MCVFESRYINTLIFENIFKISGLFIHTCFILWRATLSSSLWANIKFGSSPWLEVKRFRVTLCLFTSLSRILFSSVKSWNKNKEWMQCRKMWNWLALKNISWKQFDGNFCERLYCSQHSEVKWKFTLTKEIFRQINSLVKSWFHEIISTSSTEYSYFTGNQFQSRTPYSISRKIKILHCALINWDFQITTFTLVSVMW